MKSCWLARLSDSGCRNNDASKFNLDGMGWTKGEPEPETPDTIVVVHKDHGPMLATWQPHRGAFIGVKPTGETYGPFYHANLEAGSILKWMKIG